MMQAQTMPQGLRSSGDRASAFNSEWTRRERHEEEAAAGGLDPGRHGDRHHRRLHDLRAVSRQEDRGADRGLHLDHVGRVPAADQDADRRRWCSRRWWWASRTWATPPRSDACSPRRSAGSSPPRWCRCCWAWCSPILLQPGHNLGLPLPDIGTSANLATSKFTLKDFVSHLVPKSFAEAMANNEILQIVVFSMFFGVALAALGDKAKTLVDAIDELSHVMLKITGYVMKLAPLAVLAAMAATVAVNGLEILVKFAVFMGEFYLGLIILWGLLIFAGFVVPRAAHRSAAGADQGGLHGLVRDRELRGGVSEDTRRARPLRRQAQDLELRDAHGLFVQPRRLDDVLHVRDAVHRAGLRHRAARSAPSSRCCSS